MNTTQKIDCGILHVFGVYSVFLFIFGIFINFLNLWVFRKAKLFTSLNFFMMVLIGLNLIATILEFPYIIYNSFNCKVIVDDTTCSILGFIMYVAGNMGTYLLMAISIERYIMMLNPTKKITISYKICFLVVVICFAWSVLWAVLPLLGWSYYVAEGIGLSCSVEWNNHSINVMSYNITIFSLVYVVPVIVLIVANLRVIKTLKETRQRIQSTNDKQSQKKFSKQRTVTLVSIAQIGTFLLAWSPYAFISMYIAFVRTSEIDPLVASIPAFFAKSGVLWPALLNLYVQKKETKNVLLSMLPNAIRGLFNINQVEPLTNSLQENESVHRTVVNSKI